EEPCPHPRSPHRRCRKLRVRRGPTPTWERCVPSLWVGNLTRSTRKARLFGRRVGVVTNRLAVECPRPAWRLLRDRGGGRRRVITLENKDGAALPRLGA